MYDDIPVLRGLEPIRRRPGMYVGDLGEDGLMYMVRGVIDNAIREQLDGPATYCRVTIEGDTMTVEDDGRGISVSPTRHTPALTELEDLLSRLSMWGRDVPPSRWHRPRYGCALPVVNALSARFEVEVRRGGRRYQIRFERGERCGPLRDVGPTSRSGTRIRFTPDVAIFGTLPWNRPSIASYLRERAALGAGLTAVVQHEVFRSPDGLVDLARHLTADATRLHEPVRAQGVYRRRHEKRADAADPVDPDAETIEIDAALVWTDRQDTVIRTFLNGQAITHGNHVGAIHSSIRRALRGVAPERVAGSNPAAFHEVMRPGLVGIVHVITKRPILKPHECRWRLADPAVRTAVRTTVIAGLTRALVDDPALRLSLLARLP